MHYFLWTDDHSRVILETDHESGKSDYINANYIDVSMSDVRSSSWKCFYFLVAVRRKYSIKQKRQTGICDVFYIGKGVTENRCVIRVYNYK